MKQGTVKHLVLQGVWCIWICSLMACGSESDISSSHMDIKDDSTILGSAADEEQLGDIFLPSDSAESDSGGENVLSIALPSTYLHTDYSPWYDKLVAEIETYTGVKVDWKWYDSKTYAQQIESDIQSGQVADIIVTEKTDTFLSAAEAGLFWDLSSYIGEYENLNRIPQANLMVAYHNGSLYGIPRIPTCSTFGVGYRSDWLEKLGMDAPADWESFCEMLYAFTYNDPDGNGIHDTVGLYMDKEGECWDVMESWFGVANEWGVDENGELVHKTRTREYREAYRAFRELYEKGVINNGVNGTTDFREVEKRAEGCKASVGGCTVANLTSFRTIQSALEEAGVTSVEEPVVGILTHVDTGAGRYTHPSASVKIMSRKMLAISTKNITTGEQLKKVLQFLNDVNDGECANLIYNGWEGITYTLTEEGYLDSSVRYYTKQEQAEGLHNFRWGFSEILLGFAKSEDGKLMSYQLEPLYEQGIALDGENMSYSVPDYGWQYTSETEAQQDEALETKLLAAEWQYITGEIDEAGFEAALDAWWEAGGEAVTREKNEKYHAVGE